MWRRMGRAADALGRLQLLQGCTTAYQLASCRLRRHLGSWPAGEHPSSGGGSSSGEGAAGRSGSGTTFTQAQGHGAAERLTLVDGRLLVEPAQAAAQAVPGPWSAGALRAALRRHLAATFLPAGYPANVAPGYLRFVWWQALHHFVGSVNGVLASTFLLYSVGLGAGAIPTAGALNWVLKDGMGQLGTLLFGKAIAHSFDVNARGWYLAASAKLNVAMGLEVATLLAPQWFLPLGAAANAIKGLAWMSGGSSRSAFNVAFAADNNIADLTAKATSQTICTSMAGTAAGAALAAHIGQSLPLAAASFSAAAAVHLWTSWESVRSVPLTTLSPTRLQLLAAAYLEQQQWQQQHGQRQEQSGGLTAARKGGSGSISSSSAGGSKGGPAAALPAPWQMARLEPVVASARWHRDSGLPQLHIGASLSELHRRHPALLAALLPLSLGCRHILVPEVQSPDGVGGRRGGSSGQRNGMEGACAAVYIILHEQATPQDCILAVLHSQLAAQRLCQPPLGGECLRSPGSGSGGAAVADVAAAVRSSLAAAQHQLPGLLAVMTNTGWDVGRVTLETARRRASW